MMAKKKSGILISTSSAPLHPQQIFDTTANILNPSTGFD
ncbi:hypothetical protein APA_1288 [Pseudanabaena sp. lw0831]|nr:hypothetical protein APA_1288 [Pseudanabaena sp. lw0831]